MPMTDEHLKHPGPMYQAGDRVQVIEDADFFQEGDEGVITKRSDLEEHDRESFPEDEQDIGAHYRDKVGMFGDNRGWSYIVVCDGMDPGWVHEDKLESA